jgi:hypothetical protein
MYEKYLDDDSLLRLRAPSLKRELLLINRVGYGAGSDSCHSGYSFFLI